MQGHSFFFVVVVFLFLLNLKHVQWVSLLRKVNSIFFKGGIKHFWVSNSVNITSNVCIWVTLLVNNGSTMFERNMLCVCRTYCFSIILVLFSIKPNSWDFRCSCLFNVELELAWHLLKVQKVNELGKRWFPPYRRKLLCSIDVLLNFEWGALGCVV